VLPFSASDHPGTDGPILVYDFAGASSVAYTECNGGGRVVESADEVGDLTTILNTIRAAALPPRESTSPPLYPGHGSAGDAGQSHACELEAQARSLRSETVLLSPLARLGLPASAAPPAVEGPGTASAGPPTPPPER
jgi:Domain of unknown function (DUF5753)